MSTNHGLTPAEFRVSHKRFNPSFSPSSYMESLRIEMAIQNLITWLWYQYGVYFYFQQFKRTNEKMLVQVYFYKTYMYRQSPWRNREFWVTKGVEGCADDDRGKRYDFASEWIDLYYPDFFPLLLNSQITAKMPWHVKREKGMKYHKNKLTWYKNSGLKQTRNKAKHVCRRHQGWPHQGQNHFYRQASVPALSDRKLTQAVSRHIKKLDYDGGIIRPLGRALKRPLSPRGLALVRRAKRKRRKLMGFQSKHAYHYFFFFFVHRFFKQSSIVLSKSLYKAAVANLMFKAEHKRFLKRLRSLRGKRWWFDFLFLSHYGVTFANIGYMLPYYLMNVVADFDQYKHAELFFNLLRQFYFYKRHIKAVKVSLAGTYDHHGRTRLRVFRLGFVAVTFGPACVLYDAIQWPTGYGSVSMKLWIYYADYRAPSSRS